MTPSAAEPYQLDRVFERGVVTLACSNRRFFGRIGYAIDPELLDREPAKLAMRAAKAIHRENGRGPASSTIVIQRLRRWMQDGKVTFEALSNVAKMFDRAEDAGLPEVDDAVEELAPIIQSRMKTDALHSMITAHGQQQDFHKGIAIAEKAARVGQVDTSVGTIFGGERKNDSWKVMESLRQMERLKIGITELDVTLDGGLQRGGLGIWIASSGGGKSIALDHIAAVNVLDGLVVAYATLELPEGVILARTKAAMTGIPINALLTGDTRAAKRIFKKLAPTMGKFIVQEFAPRVTTIQDIFDWVSHVEETLGREIDLLIVDYGDKVGTRKTSNKQDDTSYGAGLEVFEGLRYWAHERKKFCWTASQATRQKDKRKRLDLDDVADSMHKVRVGDLIITINMDESMPDVQQVKLFIAKHRTGINRVELGPFPTAFELGQLIAS